MVNELLVGDNPFLGISHMAQEKGSEEREQSSQKTKAEVLASSLTAGATAFTFTACEENLEFLKYMKAKRPEILAALNYYILVPYAQAYVRKANIAGSPNLMIRSASRTLHAPSTFLDVVSSMLRRNPDKLIGAFLRTELSPFLGLLPRSRIKAILLHEVLADLILAFELTDLLRSLSNYLRDSMHLSMGLETRNFGHLCPYLLTAGYWPNYLMIPFNPLGYQMAPNKESVEQCVRTFGDKTGIVAMNVLASGACTLQEAITYLQPFKQLLHGVTCASAKPTRISDNFRQISSNLM